MNGASPLSPNSYSTASYKKKNYVPNKLINPALQALQLLVFSVYRQDFLTHHLFSYHLLVVYLLALFLLNKDWFHQILFPFFGLNLEEYLCSMHFLYVLKSNLIASLRR